MHVVGLSILSGSHVALVARGAGSGCETAGLGDVPVVVGGIIPPDDAEALIKAGVARVYTPKDFDLTRSWPTSSPSSTAAERSGVVLLERGPPGPLVDHEADLEVRARSGLAVACSIGSTTAWLNSQASAWSSRRRDGSRATGRSRRPRAPASAP